MKYLIIGEPCLDVIHKHNGETARSYGGILYSIIAMSVFCRSEDVIIPIMNVGEDESKNINILLSQYKNIDTSGINTIDFPTRRVNLDYSLYGANNERFETSTQPTHPIDYSIIEKFLPDADAVLINMISGTDITLDTMKSIRQNFKGYIHIDIHNLVMKTGDDGMRSYTNPVSWMDWCTNADIVMQNVDASVPINTVCNQTLTGRFTGGIEFEDTTLSALFPDHCQCFLCRTGIAVNTDDGGPFLRKPECGCSAISDSGSRCLSGAHHHRDLFC